MDSGMIIVLVIVVVLVVGVNGLLILNLRRGFNKFKSPSLWFGQFRNITRRARNPWENENKDLEELSKLVEQLKDKDK